MKRLNTIPNLVTLFRFILIPFICYYILQGKTTVAVIIFIIASLSDRLDGFLARKLNQSTYYGGYFDALTDSIMIFTTIFFSYMTHHVTILLLIILFIPKIVTFLLQTFLHKGRYKPTVFSRLSSVNFYILIPLFLLNIDQRIIYLLIITLYLLSVIHWIKLIKIKFKIIST